MKAVCTKWIALAGTVLCAMFAATSGAQDTASVVGIVLDATTLRPFADATIEIEQLARTTLTNARGAFTFENVPVGDYIITARAIGCARFRTTVPVSGKGRTELPIHLPKMTGLDTVVVSSLAREPLVFVEAQALGLGSFVGSDLLAKSGDRRLGDILTTVRSALSCFTPDVSSRPDSASDLRCSKCCTERLGANIETRLSSMFTLAAMAAT